MSGQIDGMYPGQPAPAPSDWSPYRSHDHRIAHTVDGTPACHSGTMSDEPGQPAPQPWRVRPALGITKILGGALILGLAAVAGGHDPVQWFLAVASALALTAWGGRDLVAPVRLAADRSGVTVVVGYAGRRRLAWSQIERVRVDRRVRLGLRSNLLEVDVGDMVYLFSTYDLGADPEDVLRTLLALRSASSSDKP